MSEKTRKRGVADMLRTLNSTAVKAGPAAAASYGLIGAIILLGGLGYFVDGWLGTAPWFLVGGLVLALVYGFVQLALVVWRKP
jgi:F0F1-type ATP synthase assembly protein I